VRLGLQTDITVRILTPDDLVEIVREMVRINHGKGTADDIDHLGNRRVRAVGELIQNQFRVGLLRMERVVKERMSITDPATATPSSLTNTAGSDLSQLASFVLFNRSVAEPAGVLADELRIGTTWAGVTPRSTVPPILNVRRIGNNVVLSWPINAAGFLPESSPVLETNSWAAVLSPLYFVGNQSVVTNTPTGTLTFYRLRKSP